MDGANFDDLVKRAVSASRRQVLGGLLGGLAMAVGIEAKVGADPPEDKNKNVETVEVVCEDQSRILVTIGQSQSVAEQIEGETGVVILRELTFFVPGEPPERHTFTKGKGLQDDLVRCEGFSQTRQVPFEALVTITPRGSGNR